MELPTRHDVVHAAINTLSGYVFVGFIMFIIYGTDVVSHFSNDGCNMKFMDKHSVNRNIIQAIFFAGAGSYAVGVRVFGLKRNDTLLDKLNGKTVFFLAALILSMCAGIMTLFGVYSGQCANTDANAAVALEINGKIDSVGLFAGVTWSLLVCFAILDFDVVAWRSSDNRQTTVVVLFTHVLTMAGWLVRLVFTACMVHLMREESGTKFFTEYGNAALGTATCASITPDTPKWYQHIELGAYGVHANGKLYINRNDRLWGMLLSVLAAVIVEFFLRLDEGVVVYGEKWRWSVPSWFRSGRPWFMSIARFLQLYSHLGISILIFVLISSNEYAACPLLDSGKGLIEAIYWTSNLHLFIGFVNLVWKEYTFHENIDDKRLAAAGNVYTGKHYKRVGTY